MAEQSDDPDNYPMPSLDHLGTVRESLIYASVKTMLSQEPYTSLRTEELLAEDSLYLTITGKSQFISEGAGPVNSPRLLLKFETKSDEPLKAYYNFQVLFRSVEAGEYDKTAVETRLQQLLKESGYVTCPGITQLQSEKVKCNTKKLRLWGEPFQRIDSVKCAAFHQPNNRKLHPLHPLYNCCFACKELFQAIKKHEKKAARTSPTTRKKRLTASSHYPISKLSPVSQQARVKNVMLERKAALKRLKKIDLAWRCNLDDQQSQELARIVDCIDAEHGDTLEQVLKESDPAGKGDYLRKVWEQDRNERVSFWRDQARNGMI